MTGSLKDTIAGALNSGAQWVTYKPSSPIVVRIADALRAAGVVPAEPATHDHDDEVLDIITGIEAERVELCRKALAAADELDAIAYDGMALKPRDRLCRIADALRAASVVPAEPATHDNASVWLVEDASGTPGYHSVSDGTFHVLAPTSIAQHVSDLLNAGAQAVAAVDGEAPAT